MNRLLVTILVWLIFVSGYANPGYFENENHSRLCNQIPQGTNLRDSICYYLTIAESSSQDSVEVAIAHYEHAIKLLSVGRPLVLLSELYARIGDLYRFIAFSPSVVKAYLKSYELAVRSGDRTALALACNKLGDLYRQTRQNENAIRYYDRALSTIMFYGELNCQSTFSVIAVKTLIGKGLAYYAIEKYEEALAIFNKTLSVSACGDPKQLIRVHINISCTYREMGAYTLAMKHINQAILMIDFARMPDSWLYAMLDKAELLRKIKNYDEAIRILDSVLDKAGKQGKESCLHMAIRQKMELYEAMAIPDSIQKYKYLYREIDDSYYNRNQLSEVFKEVLSFESAHQERKIKEIAEQSQVFKNNYYLYGVAVLMVMMVISWYYQRTRQQKNKKLVDGYLLTQSESKRPPQSDQEKYSQSALSDQTRQDLIANIKKMLIQEKHYRDQTLGLNSLACLLDVNRTYLSQCINEHYKMSFNQLISELRVKDACLLLQDPENEKYSIAGIGAICGFRSYQSFIRAFKYETGENPSDFKNRQIERLVEASLTKFS